MPATIRSARRDDLPAIFELLADSFPEAPGLFEPQTLQDSTFRLRHGRVAVVDGSVAGYVRIFARTMLVRGVSVRAGGIGSVATRPGARHGGIATALLEDAMAQMRREGMAVSFLFTGIPGFYERLGFRIVEQSWIDVDAGEARALPIDLALRVRTIEDRDVPRLVRFYNGIAIADGVTGAIARTPRTWRDAQHWLEEDADGCVIAERDGHIVAYARSRCRPYGHQVLEAECARRDMEALRAVLAAAAARAFAHDERLVALAPGESDLRAEMEALASVVVSPPPNPMMMRVLSDDPAIERAIFGDPIRFWSADRI